MIATTVERVPSNTADRVNAEIRRQTEENIARCVTGGREAIDRRLAELDREWDVERIIESEAPMMILTGLLMGNTLGRGFLIVPVFAASMLLLHSVQGWYPLLPLLRRMGIRTAEEIDRERYTLKVLRGDFEQTRRDRTEVRPGRAHEMTQSRRF